MCTAVTYRTKDFYFGRNLDYERSFGEQTVVLPRRFPLPLRFGGALEEHYAMIGMAHMQDGYPLYYDAANEKGLCIAGLNFVGSAVYAKPREDALCVATYELIPWLLGRCASVAEARALLKDALLAGENFHGKLPPSQLHWLLADREECAVLEATAEGTRLYENPVGVLTNNPPFPYQLFALNNYAQLSAGPMEDRFAKGLRLEEYSRGMGALGLPGDLSSQSRFIRAAFVRMNSRSPEDELSSVSQTFHILRSVEQPRGCCRLANGEYEYTLYSCCINADRGVYYYTTYDRPQPVAVALTEENMEGTEPTLHPLPELV